MESKRYILYKGFCRRLISEIILMVTGIAAPVLMFLIRNTMPSLELYVIPAICGFVWWIVMGYSLILTIKEINKRNVKITEHELLVFGWVMFMAGIFLAMAIDERSAMLATFSVLSVIVVMSAQIYKHIKR